ncbi:hypothetical protein B0A49_12801, partial [Cryomyces minteri]
MSTDFLQRRKTATQDLEEIRDIRGQRVKWEKIKSSKAARGQIDTATMEAHDVADDADIETELINVYKAAGVDEYHIDKQRKRKDMAQDLLTEIEQEEGTGSSSTPSQVSQTQAQAPSSSPTTKARARVKHRRHRYREYMEHTTEEKDEKEWEVPDTPEPASPNQTSLLRASHPEELEMIRKVMGDTLGTSWTMDDVYQKVCHWHGESMSWKDKMELCEREADGERETRLTAEEDLAIANTVIDKLNKDVQDSKAEISDKGGKIVQLDFEVEILGEQLESLELQLKRRTAEAQQAARAVQGQLEAETQVRSMSEREVHDLEGQLKQLNALLDTEKESSSALQAKTQDLMGGLNTASARSDTLLAENSSLVREKTAAENEVRTLGAKLESVETSLKALYVEKQSLTREKTAVDGALKAVEAKTRSANASLEELKQERTRLNEALESAETARDAADKACLAKEALLQAERQQHHAARRAKDAAEQANEVQKQQLEVMRKEKNDQTQELEAARQANEAQKQELESAQHTAQDVSDRHGAVLEDRQAELSRAQAKVRQWEDEVAKNTRLFGTALSPILRNITPRSPEDMGNRVVRGVVDTFPAITPPMFEPLPAAAAGWYLSVVDPFEFAAHHDREVKWNGIGTLWFYIHCASATGSSSEFLVILEHVIERCGTMRYRDFRAMLSSASRIAMDVEEMVGMTAVDGEEKFGMLLVSLRCLELIMRVGATLDNEAVKERLKKDRDRIATAMEKSGVHSHLKAMLAWIDRARTDPLNLTGLPDMLAEIRPRATAIDDRFMFADGLNCVVVVDPKDGAIRRYHVDQLLWVADPYKPHLEGIARPLQTATSLLDSVVNISQSVNGIALVSVMCYYLGS